MILLGLFDIIERFYFVVILGICLWGYVVLRDY